MGHCSVLISCGNKDVPPPLGTAGTPPIDRGKVRPTVLIVDDERIIADTIAHVLHLSGFRAEAVYSGRSALEQIVERCPDVVITDVVMPEMNGIEMAKRLAASCPKTKILLLSGQAATAEMIQQARAEGFQFELLAKPLHPEDLIGVLRRLGF
jgi:CheY-like chemotaxis protein